MYSLPLPLPSSNANNKVTNMCAALSEPTYIAPSLNPYIVGLLALNALFAYDSLPHRNVENATPYSMYNPHKMPCP